jgi:predicted nuclease with TOPRIM domain
MSSATQIHEIETLTEQFINRFAIKSHHDLKRMSEFKSLPEDIRGKLYDKVRYKTNKVKLKLITSDESDFPEKRKSLLQNKENYPTIILLIFIFLFLASEAIKFYDQFCILPLFKYLIPISIEFAIILLSLKNSKISKFLTVSLIIFNIAAFTFKTIQNDQNLKNEKIILNTKRELLKNEIDKLQNETLRTNKEHDELLNNYNSLVSRGFFKVAEHSYSSRILKNEEYKNVIQQKITENNSEYLKVSVSGSGSHNLLAIETVFMIFLKVILQITFVYLLLDLKEKTNA